MRSVAQLKRLFSDRELEVSVDDLGVEGAIRREAEGIAHRLWNHDSTCAID